MLCFMCCVNLLHLLSLMCAIKERLLRGTAVSAVVSKMVLATVALFRHLVVLFDVIAVTLHTVFS